MGRIIADEIENEIFEDKLLEREVGEELRRISVNEIMDESERRSGSVYVPPNFDCNRYFKFTYEGDKSLSLDYSLEERNQRRIEGSE